VPPLGVSILAAIHVATAATKKHKGGSRIITPRRPNKLSIVLALKLASQASSPLSLPPNVM
jgi:hypothetical protein